MSRLTLNVLRGGTDSGPASKFREGPSRPLLRPPFAESLNTCCVGGWGGCVPPPVSNSAGLLIGLVPALLQSLGSVAAPSSTNLRRETLLRGWLGGLCAASCFKHGWPADWSDSGPASKFGECSDPFFEHYSLRAWTLLRKRFGGLCAPSCFKHRWAADFTHAY